MLLFLIQYSHYFALIFFPCLLLSTFSISPLPSPCLEISPCPTQLLFFCKSFLPSPFSLLSSYSPISFLPTQCALCPFSPHVSNLFITFHFPDFRFLHQPPLGSDVLFFMLLCISCRLPFPFPICSPSTLSPLHCPRIHPFTNRQDPSTFWTQVFLIRTKVPDTGGSPNTPPSLYVSTSSPHEPQPCYSLLPSITLKLLSSPEVNHII